jgi:hypothetical protein
MYLLNITFLVDPSTLPVWKDWLHLQFIPTMQSLGDFRSPQLARIHTDTEENGLSFALQFGTPSIEIIHQWNKQHQSDLLQVCNRKFVGMVLFFSTTLEIIE